MGSSVPLDLHAFSARNAAERTWLWDDAQSLPN